MFTLVLRHDVNNAFVEWSMLITLYELSLETIYQNSLNSIYVSVIKVACKS